MSAAVAPLPDMPGDDEAVDLDLDAEDQLLREAVGMPVRIRVAGQVIEVPHSSDWTPAANAAAARADFDTWAALVLSEDDLKTWQRAGLRNYQVNAIFERFHKRTGTSPGKSQPLRASSGSTRRR